jgi:hypothetical protein
MKLYISKKELNKWFTLTLQVKNGYHLSSQDKTELLQLNYKVMETAHDIHNKNMLNNLK